MLKLKRRCVVADDTGRQHEFRVVRALPGGVLVLLTAQDAESVRFLAAAGDPADVVGYLRDHVVALDPAKGTFLTTAGLKEALAQAGDPLLRIVALTA